jgi:hypothetical protein
VGCGCGAVHLVDRATPSTVDGVVHRYGLPCHRVGESSQAGLPPPERADREGDQALPAGGQGDDLLLDLMEERRQVGLRRYGQPLRAFNGRSAARDLREELLDAANYSLQVEREMAALELAVVALARRLAGRDAEFGSVEAAIEVAEAVERKLARQRGVG